MAGFTAASALAVVAGAMKVLGPVLAAQGVNVAAINAALASATAAAASLGPAAPAAIMAVYLTKAGLAIRKDRLKNERCKDRAGQFAIVELPDGLSPLRHIPTSEWDECWRKGEKAAKKFDGRYSMRIPLTVYRGDVLSTSTCGGPSLAHALTGRLPNKGGKSVDREILAVSWLGPWGLGRGGVRKHDLAGWSPGGTLAAIKTLELLLNSDTISKKVRDDAARLVLWAAKALAGVPVMSCTGKMITVVGEGETTKNLREIAEVAGALALKKVA